MHFTLEIVWNRSCSLNVAYIYNLSVIIYNTNYIYVIVFSG